jgi:hypothetical protein
MDFRVGKIRATAERAFTYARVDRFEQTNLSALQLEKEG